MKIILASSNRGKISEFQDILKNFPVELLALPDLENVPPIEETGSSFIENAFIKANAVAGHFGQLTIGEDSGLEVPALDGEPGIYSSRYAKRLNMISADVTDSKQIDRVNNDALLARMKDLSGEDRRAFFRCVIVVVDPRSNRCEIVEGSLPGVIITSPRGDRGFGYDPIFLVPENNVTVAEMSADQKNAISHRARALSALKEILPSFIEDLKF